MKDFAGKVAVVTGGAGHRPGARRALHRGRHEGRDRRHRRQARSSRPRKELRAQGRTSSEWSPTSPSSPRWRPCATHARGLRRGACFVQQRRHRLWGRGALLGAPRQRLAMVAGRQRDGRRQRHQRIRAGRCSLRTPRAPSSTPHRATAASPRWSTARSMRRPRRPSPASPSASGVSCASGREGDRAPAVSIDPHARDDENRHLAARPEPAAHAYDRPGAPPADTGRDGLAGLLERAKAAGQEVTFAPLSEVADLCFEGIGTTFSGSASPGPARARSRGRNRKPTAACRRTSFKV